MTQRATRNGQAVKAVEKFEGQFKSGPTKKKLGKTQPKKPPPPPIEESEDVDCDSEGMIAFEKVLIIPDEAISEEPAPRSPPVVPRSPTPPDDVLPKIPTRLIVKCSGTTMQTTKLVSLDFNEDFDQFNYTVLPIIHAKAGEKYDPVDFDPKYLKLKYTIVLNTRVAVLSKKPLLPNEYYDLDDNSDYDALRDEIRIILSSQARGSAEHLQKHTIMIHATLTKRAESPRDQQLNSSAPAVTSAVPETSLRVVSSLKLYITDRT
jgi:hypothetical protein